VAVVVEGPARLPTADLPAPPSRAVLGLVSSFR
jgi:hypothetical protein